MLDTVGEFLFFGFVPLSLALLLASLYLLRHFGIGRRVAASMLFSTALAVASGVTAVSILFRDGMGPKSVRSHGWLALSRLLPDVAAGLGAGFLLAVFAGCLLWSHRPVRA